MFKRLNIKEWRQFSNVDIIFHPHLTVLTGANGAGKTTILNLLAQSTGWNPKFVGSYKKEDKEKLEYNNSLNKTEKRSFIRALKMIKDIDNQSADNKLGELEFSDGKIADLLLPETVKGGTYAVSIQGQTGVRGIYVDSHRPTFPYRAVETIPTAIATRQEIFEKYNAFHKTFVHDTYRNAEKVSATSLIKDTLAALAIFGYGNESVVARESARQLFEGYVEILKQVLPPKLGFEKITVIVPEVVLCTKTGDFPIDAVSGGISSIIDITWQLYMFADTNEHFVAIIDEPENHLHPELQKSFLGNLIKAFPNVQFVIATHNPFMITSQKDSNVFVLNYNEDNKVYACQLDYINRAGTSNMILRDVLGIESTMPIWAETTLEEIITKYSQIEFTSENLLALRSELSSFGLSDYVPETIARVAEGNGSDDKT